MIPKSLKPWSFVKDKKYDISPLEKQMVKDPEMYHYQYDRMDDRYYPAVLTFDLMMIPDK